MSQRIRLALAGGAVVTLLVTVALAIVTLLDTSTAQNAQLWGMLSGSLYGQIAGMLVCIGFGHRRSTSAIKRDLALVATASLTTVVASFVALTLVQLATGFAQPLALMVSFPSAVLVATLGACFLAFRWWLTVRKSRLIWNIANVFLITLVVLAIMMAGLLSVPAIIDQIESEGSVTMLVMTRYVPTFLALLVLSLVMFAFTLPPIVILGYLAIRSATRRIHDLTRTTSRFREGDLDARVTVEGADEIAQLQTNFNAMADQLQETLERVSFENERVSALLRQRRELFAAVSHELRTPAATIRLALESVLRQTEGATTQAEIATAVRQIDLLTRLIDDIFTLARVEVAALTVRSEPINVATLVERSVEAMTGVAWSSRKVSLVTGCEPGAMIQGDPDRLDQAVRNLISNAIRHSLPGGIVRIAVGTTDLSVAVSVANNGIGIPLEDRERIWEPFVTGSSSESSDRTGLGLSLVRSLTEAMGGTVDVESEEDEGATFVLTFPRVASRQSCDTSETPPQQSKNETVTSPS